MKTIKHLLITIAVLLCSVAANAYDFEVDGIYYNIISFSDLTLEVTHGDNSYTGTVVIPSTVSYKSKTLSVTSIGDDAFQNCTNLTSITIPSSVISIGNYAFQNCSLENLRIEDGTEILSLGYNYYNYSTSNGIGQGLFYKCKLKTLYLGRNISYSASRAKGYSPFYNKSTLTSVTIGNSVTTIEQRMFEGCSSLTSIEIPNSVTSIGEWAFSGCTGLTSVTIPNSVTSIGDDAFYDCSNFKEVHITDIAAWCNIDFSTSYSNPLDCAKNLYLNGELVTNLVIPDGVTEIKQYAFHRCSSLTSIEIPNSVTTIGYAAFENCTNLTSVTIPNSVTSIGNYAFFDCSSLTSIEIPNSVTSIGEWTFSRCSSLTSVTIPNSVTTIGYGAFYKCSSLTNVTIGNSVTTIEQCVFEGCSSLANIVIGKGLAIIKSEAFKGCPNFVSIYLEGTIPPIVGDDNFTKSHYMDATVYVPIGSLSTYQTADTWENFWDIQELDATGIEDVNANDIAIKVTANGIALFDTDGKTVAIYSANGTRVANIDSYVGEEITLDRGVYIVRVGSNTLKVKL